MNLVAKRKAPDMNEETLQSIIAACGHPSHVGEGYLVICQNGEVHLIPIDLFFAFYAEESSE